MEFCANITVTYATETEMSDSTTPTCHDSSPDYVPSSHTASPDPLPFQSPDVDVPMLMPAPQVHPISPRTTANVLHGFNLDDPVRLRGITESLIQTIRHRDRLHHQEQDKYAITIAELHKKLAEFQKEAWKHIPPGYEENNCFPLLTVD